MTNSAEGVIRLLICDDQAIVCEGLRAILEPVSHIEVVGVVHNGADAVELTRTLQPDLVLMDLKMPRMNGIQATKAIHACFPAVRVLILSTYDDEEWVLDAMRAGASGYLLKDTPQEGLLKAIMDTMRGWNPIDPQVAGKILKQIAQPSADPAQDKSARIALDNTQLSQLSERERAVLRLLATGLSNSDIAQTLFLSEGTVKNYVSTIFSKLNVTDRTQAAILAIRTRLVNLGAD